MTAAALIGNDFRFQRETSAGSSVYQDICAAVNFGEFGEEKTLLDITTLCSTGREYRGGLADGLEIPLQLNFKDGEPLARALYADYAADRTPNFRIVVVGGSPTESFQFAATIRGWRVTAPVGERATIQFTLKISGAVVWAY